MVIWENWAIHTVQTFTQMQVVWEILSPLASFRGKEINDTVLISASLWSIYCAREFWNVGVWPKVLRNILICFGWIKWWDVDLLVLLAVTEYWWGLLYFVIVGRPHLCLVCCSISLQSLVDSDLLVISLVYVTSLRFLSVKTVTMGNIVLTLVLWLTIPLRGLWDSSWELIWEFTWTYLRVDSYLVAFVHNIFHSLFYFLLS